jgi:hypothetical protein
MVTIELTPEQIGQLYTVLGKELRTAEGIKYEQIEELISIIRNA